MDCPLTPFSSGRFTKNLLVGAALVFLGVSSGFCELTLGQIKIEGNASVPEKEILKILQLKSGGPFDQEKFQLTVSHLRSAYIDKGFLDVKISTEVSVSLEVVTPLVRIAEGAVYQLRSLTVEGNREISSEIIHREFEVKLGEPFSLPKMLDGNKRLYATGCFDTIDLAMSTASAHSVDVLVKVRERRKKFFKGGAGYGTESKERLTVGFEDQNFLGGARRADIKYTHSGFITQPDKNETRSLEATMIQPFIFGTRMEGQFSLERARKFREAYDSNESNMRSSLERRFTPAFSTRLSYRYEGTDLTRVSPEAETPSVTSVNAVGTGIRYDNTDDRFLPRVGWRAIGSVEEGLQIFKHDVGFHKLEGRLGRFDTVIGGWTFFEGFQSGLIVPLSDEKTDVIPIDERFFLGGANSVRGYSERSLGPQDEEGDPLGGTFFMVGNFEARHKIYKKVFGVAFFDIGNLFDKDSIAPGVDRKLSAFGDLKQGCGVGIRLHSPVGAIRLEAGYQLNPEGSPNFSDRTAIHFSIGEVF